MKTISLILLMASAAFGQISGAGQFGCNAATVTNPGGNLPFTTSTSINTISILATGISASVVSVVIDGGANLTAGAVTLMSDPGDGNYVNHPVSLILSPSTFTSLTNPYTLVSSTNQQFFVYMAGATKLQAKLTTAITTSSGTGSTAIYVTPVCYLPPAYSGGPFGATTGSKSVPVIPATDWVLPAGTNVIGHTIIDSGSTTVVTGTTTVAGTVQPGNTPNTTAWLVQPVPGTTNGLTNSVIEAAASDNHANIKNGAGVVYHVSATNNSATINYLRLYNAATGFNGCNSATNLIYETEIPASTSGAGIVDDWPLGITFSTGISICITGAFGQTSTTSATASAIEVNVGYK